AGAIQTEVDALTAAGVNKIVVISHLQDIDDDIALAADLTGVDVMIAGGGDELLANPGDPLVPGEEGDVFGAYPLTATGGDGASIPVVTTPGEYKYLGQLTVGFDADGNVTAVGTDSGPKVVDGTITPDAGLLASVVDPIAAAVATLDATVLGTSEVALDGTRTSVRGVESNEGNLIAAALLWQATELAASFGVTPPDVAIQNGGGIRNNTVIPAGDITVLDTFDMVPFSNFVSVLEDIPRAQFKDILENAYSQVPGGGRFAQLAGVSVVYDQYGFPMVIDGESGAVTQVGNRIVDVVLDDGTVLVANGMVVPGDPITIATIDFLARGGDQYPYNGAPFTSVGVTYQQAVANYIVDGLGGAITAADYPEGGEGRITTLAAPTDFGLVIHHNNDGESQLVNAGSGLEDFGGVARFGATLDVRRRISSNSRFGDILLSSGDNFLAGPEFNASLENGVPFYDTIAMDMLGYDAIAIGNHDFDFGPDVLADFIEGYSETMPPYVSANLGFADEPRLQALADAGRIVSSTVISERGMDIGIVGATTPNINFISSPRDVDVMEDVAGIVQAEVDALTASGVKIIILISHLQDIDEDVALAAMLSDVDVMIAGGGDELLANPGNPLIPGEEGDVFGPYPIVATDADGAEVPVVTTPGEYKYLGELWIGFDPDGKSTLWAGSPIRIQGAQDAGIFDAAVAPVIAATETLDATVIGTSEVALDGTRTAVRGVESNEGNLIADALRWQATQLADSFGVAVPDVAIQNGGGIRNNTVIEAGDITLLDT
ncbi:MAG: 5'-nucleotidase C-terminal domain-containing protein, partial [Acidimicrobiia bacterium]|nr:5'-nucleotidase C-terminal domain-containing protein [Acidimicrobiia bacterium]